MTKLTHLEATKILIAVYQLRTQYHKSGSRLGQLIHWAANPELSSLEIHLQKKLAEVLDSHHATDIDFFYWTDESEVLKVFYTHYVEKIN